MAAFRDLPLEGGRRSFLKWIIDCRPHGSRNNQITVVFDGHPDHYGASPQGEIRVIFSEGCSADETIKGMVEENPDRKNCVVVSDDKEVFLYARSLGAKVMSVAAFAVKALALNQRVPTAGKNISLSCQEKINQELRGIWLKE